MKTVPVELWRYEARRCGLAALVTPVAVVTATALLSPLTGDGMRDFLALSLPATLLPLTAGVCAVGIVSREPMPELQGSFATPYPVTVRRRLRLLIVAMGTAVALLAISSATEAGHGPITGRDTSLPLSSAASSFLLIGVGTYAAAAQRRNRGGPAAALVMTTWLAKLLVLDRIPLPPMAAATVFTAAGLWLTVRGSTRAAGEAT